MNTRARRLFRNRPRPHHSVLWLLVLLLILSAPCWADMMGVEVIDATDRTPLAEALVTVAGHVLHTNDAGMVYVPRQLPHFLVRAAGHGRVAVDNAGYGTSNLVVRLPRVTPKALYLSFYGVSDAHLRENALQLIHDTELNALVIDIKDDRGHVTFQSAVPLASAIGAQKVITVRDMAGLIASLHERGIYVIARLVAFKDNLLARSHPQWAVHRRDGSLWLDRDGIAWCDPFHREVWDYDLSLAAEAAAYGFDEIQFDYLRFPDESGIAFSQPSTQKNRVATLAEVLKTARARLASYNVFIAADLFGYAMWNTDDTGIGQYLEDVAPLLDYVSPMLYPSGFQFGIPGYRNPVTHPAEIIGLSLLNARKRTGLPSVRFRPWLQAFNDYAYDHRHFGAKQISDQVNAAEGFGSDGWMLWNPRNVYSSAGLRLKPGKNELYFVTARRE